MPRGQPAALRPTDGPGLTWVPDQTCSGWVPSNHPAARGGPRGSTPPPAAPGTQVSRLGAPLVNEVVIGLRDKDLFNSASPTQDSALASYVTNPTLPELLEILFGGAGVQAPNNFPRGDLVAAFLTGIQGLNQPPNVVASEMLRLNTSIAPVAAGQSEQARRARRRQRRIPERPASRRRRGGYRAAGRDGRAVSRVSGRLRLRPRGCALGPAALHGRCVRRRVVLHCHVSLLEDSARRLSKQHTVVSVMSGRRTEASP